MKYDIYDLIISSMGYPLENITDSIISENLANINSMKEELGIKFEKDKFNLILFDDMEHTHLEVMSDLVEVGLGEKSMNIIKEAELSGSVVLMSGPYYRLKPIHEKLRQENYRTVIRRIEKEKNE